MHLLQPNQYNKNISQIIECLLCTGYSDCWRCQQTKSSFSWIHEWEGQTINMPTQLIPGGNSRVWLWVKQSQHRVLSYGWVPWGSQWRTLSRSKGTAGTGTREGKPASAWAKCPHKGKSACAGQGGRPSEPTTGAGSSMIAEGEGLKDYLRFWKRLGILFKCNEKLLQEAELKFMTRFRFLKGGAGCYAENRSYS